MSGYKQRQPAWGCLQLRQKVGYYAVQAMRRSFDLVTGYKEHGMTEAKMMQRILFLETVAGAFDHL